MMQTCRETPSALRAMVYGIARQLEAKEPSWNSGAGRWGVPMTSLSRVSGARPDCLRCTPARWSPTPADMSHLAGKPQPWVPTPVGSSSDAECGTWLEPARSGGFSATRAAAQVAGPQTLAASRPESTAVGGAYAVYAPPTPFYLAPWTPPTAAHRDDVNRHCQLHQQQDERHPSRKTVRQRMQRQ